MLAFIIFLILKHLSSKSFIERQKIVNKSIPKGCCEVKFKIYFSINVKTQGFQRGRLSVFTLCHF